MKIPCALPRRPAARARKRLVVAAGDPQLVFMSPPNPQRPEVAFEQTRERRRVLQALDAVGVRVEVIQEFLINALLRPRVEPHPLLVAVILHRARAVDERLLDALSVRFERLGWARHVANRSPVEGRRLAGARAPARDYHARHVDAAG